MTWSRQWTPSQIRVQCVLGLSIKETGYGAASGGAWTVDWDELLLTFPPYCWGWYPVLSPPAEMGWWRGGETPEESQSGAESTGLRDEAERALASVSDGKEAKEWSKGSLWLLPGAFWTCQSQMLPSRWQNKVPWMCIMVGDSAGELEKHFRWESGVRLVQVTR